VINALGLHQTIMAYGGREKPFSGLHPYIDAINAINAYRPTAGVVAPKAGDDPGGQ